MIDIDPNLSGKNANPPDQGQSTKVQAGVMDRDHPMTAKLEKAYKICCKQYLSPCMLLRGADRGRYLKLKVDLPNNMSLGVDSFPKTIIETMRIMRCV